MEPNDVVNKILAYQACPFVHPLTCGFNSVHENLKPEINDGKVILVCPDCEYTQNWIPEFVIHADVDSIKKFLSGL